MHILGLVSLFNLAMTESEPYLIPVLLDGSFGSAWKRLPVHVQFRNSCGTPASGLFCISPLRFLPRYYPRLAWSSTAVLQQASTEYLFDFSLPEAALECRSW
jgi:hypothetical protein